MADIFSSENARELFRNKFVFMLGDSNMRATYKDLVQLVNRNALLDSNDLRRRGEPTFQGDRRIVHSGMMRGRGYAEGREFLQHEVHIEYHFITRCYTEDIEHFLHRIKDGTMKTPDVFVMNSCLWDISRWGPDGVDAYKENMNKLMMLLKECLPSETLFIWTTTLPVSSQIRGGLLIKQIDFLQDMLRFEVMEANLFCRQLVVSHGYDVLDTHYHLRMQIHRRLKDGLHYGPLPVRFVTNLLLTHISLSWGVPLPGNSQNIALERVIHECVLKVSEKSKEKEIEQLSNQLQPGNSAELKNKIEQVPHHKDFSNRGNRYKRRNHRKNIVQWENRYHNGKNWENPRPESWEARNEQVWPANHNRSEQWYNPIPPWQKHQQQQQDNTRNQNFWQDTTDHRPGPNGQAGWNNEFKEHYQRSSYANFDRVGGPVPKNKYRLNKRTRPY